jgi:two-component system cell cycle response regulator DivK
MTDGFSLPRAHDVRAGEPATCNPGSANRDLLYWSLRGEVACAKHLPVPGSEGWLAQRWAEVPPEVRRRFGRRYQCQHCADSKTPIVHRRLNTQIHLSPRMRSILLVDDFEDGLDMYREYLTYRGFHVVVARNGKEAVAQARLHRPDVILLDLRMPEMTGTEVMQVLRADPSFVTTPIVALTAQALDSERRLALNAGFDALIAKPCFPDALVVAVERILSDRTGSGTQPTESK